MRIFLVLILVALPAFAQRSLSPAAFQANVRPALGGIINDFYQMVSLFPDFPKELAPVVELIDQLESEKHNLRDKCPHLLKLSCIGNLNSIQAKLSTISTKALDLTSHQKMSTALYINTIAGIRLSNDFYVAVEAVRGRVMNLTLKLKAQVPTREPTHDLIKSLDQLGTYISLTVVEYVPYAYKDDFRHFYYNFVHPIEQHIGHSKNYEFLNRNVNSLNFALNLLIQNLTKRNKKTPEGMAPYLNLIHNRWNSLLRYYF